MKNTKDLPTMRHDMRNQLTVILAMAQLLEMKLTDEKQKLQARTITERVAILDEMINSL
jgi:signal transduction histidine kinase